MLNTSSVKDHKAILNLVPIRKGGGQQNALNFLTELGPESDLILVVNSGSKLAEFATQKNIPAITIPNGFLGRLYFELIICRRWFSRGCTCLTLFGPPPIGLIGYARTISGFAYSNILYPEIDFWGYLHLHKKILKKIIDIYRFRMARKTDVLVFETELLKNRALSSNVFPQSRLEHIPMAPSNYIPKVEPYDSTYLYNLIYVGSAHPNKRLHLLPAILKNVVERIPEVTLTMSLNGDENTYIRNVVKKFKSFGVLENVHMIGSVAPENIYKLLAQNSAIINIAALESFSNNFVESWVSGKPLIVTEADWSRHSCGSAAVYVDPENAEDTAKKIISLLSEKKKYESVLSHRIDALAGLISTKTKVEKYMELLN